MLNRKRKKQILYNTEGTDLVRPDLNKQNISNPTNQPIVPINPIEPNKQIPSAKGQIPLEPNKQIPSAKGQIPIPNPARLKPGGYDPYYSGGNTPNGPAITDPLRIAVLGNGKNITDAEGLRRAYESPSSTYVYKGVEYVAGTKGSLIGSDMRENFQYIGLPNIKSAITYNMAQIGAIASAVVPEIAGPALVGLEVATMFGKPSMSENIKKEMDIGLQVENLTRFKDAEKTYLAFRRPDGSNYIQRVVGDSSGGAVINQLKAKYKEIEGGRSYGAPVVDLFARSKIKDFLQTEKALTTAQYAGNSIANIPEKIVNAAYDRLIEKALGVDDFKSVKDTGIEQIRLLGDPVASLNNSATTLTASIDDILSKNTLTHSYDLTASNFSTSKDTTRDANGWTNNDQDKTTTLFQ